MPKLPGTNNNNMLRITDTILVCLYARRIQSTADKDERAKGGGGMVNIRKVMGL